MTYQLMLRNIPYSATLPTITTSSELLPLELYHLHKLSSHPNVQGLVEYSYDGTTKTWTLLLEYSDQWKVLSKVTSSLDEDDIRDIAQQLLSAVLHCLDHGVDHWNITTDHIFLDPSTNQIKLAGFQHSTTLSLLQHTLKHPGSAPGATPPELYHRGHYTTDGAVVWSLGCVLFELLTGTRPLQNQTDVIRNNIRWEALSPSKIPGDVYQLVLECLHPNPKFRIQLCDLINHHWIVNETAV